MDGSEKYDNVLGGPSKNSIKLLEAEIERIKNLTFEEYEQAELQKQIEEEKLKAVKQQSTVSMDNAVQKARMATTQSPEKAKAISGLEELYTQQEMLGKLTRHLNFTNTQAKYFNLPSIQNDADIIAAAAGIGSANDCHTPSSISAISMPSSHVGTSISTPMLAVSSGTNSPVLVDSHTPPLSSFHSHNISVNSTASMLSSNMHHNISTITTVTDSSSPLILLKKKVVKKAASITAYSAELQQHEPSDLTKVLFHELNNAAEREPQCTYEMNTRPFYTFSSTPTLSLYWHDQHELSNLAALAANINAQ